MEGYNAQMSAIQAAALRVKLAHLDAWLARRRAIAARYAAACDRLGLARLHPPAHTNPAWRAFVVLLPEVQPAQTPEILAWVQDAAARVRRHPELRACGASAGLAFSHESQSPSVLLNLADERMYHDKRDRKPKRT